MPPPAGAEQLWDAIYESWSHSSSTSPNGRVSFAVAINAERLQTALLEQSPPLTRSELAAAYQHMTGSALPGLPNVNDTVTREDINAVASGMAQYFNNLQNALPPRSAAQFRTLPEDAPVEQQTRFVMSTPRDPLSSFERTRDRLQHWAALRQTVEANGGQVVLMDPTRAPAANSRSLEIFAQDPALVLSDQRIALVPSQEALDRLPANSRGLVGSGNHIADMRRQLESLGYNVQEMSGYSEGGDIVYDRHRRIILVGIESSSREERFSAADATRMEEQTGCTVIRVPRSSPRRSEGTDERGFYHLDTAISVLPNGKYLINPACTDDATYQALRDRVGADNIIEIPRDERRYFANMVAVGNTLIMPACSDELRQILTSPGNGFTVVTPEDLGLPPGAWNIQDGSVHCMTLQARSTESRPVGAAGPEGAQVAANANGIGAAGRQELAVTAAVGIEQSSVPNLGGGVALSV